MRTASWAMRYLLLLVALVPVTVLVAGRSNGRTAQEIAEFRDKYLLHDQTFVDAQLKWAKDFQADFSSPKSTYETRKKYILLGEKAGYLTCFTQAFNTEHYPEGTVAYIKAVDYAKYYWLEMESEYSDFDAKQSRMLILFHIKGRTKPQKVWYKMEKVSGKWLFASR
jgi:hypothetical protein